MLVVIPGEPKAKSRPRFTRGGIAYTPKDTISYENLVKHEYMSQRGEKLTGEIMATINAYFSISKSTSKKKRKQMINGEIRPTKKPDLDNIAKIILDSLNKIAFDDDSQIVDLRVRKIYSENPRVELILDNI